MDRACADLPWQVWLEVDGKDIEIPKVSYWNDISPSFPILCGVFLQDLSVSLSSYCAFLFFANMETPTNTH